MINKLDTKKGNSGIRNLTKDPKLATVRPTEKAKNKENNIANNNMGLFFINTKKFQNLRSSMIKTGKNWDLRSMLFVLTVPWSNGRMH